MPNIYKPNQNKMTITKEDLKKIKHRLENGDYYKISEKAGYSIPYISGFFAGKYNIYSGNSVILTESMRLIREHEERDSMLKKQMEDLNLNG